MKTNAEITITPEMMAEAFWEMTDREQVKFFELLSDIIANDKDGITYGHGELQWYYMGAELNKNLKAKEMACAMMAPIFLHSTNWLESL